MPKGLTFRNRNQFVRTGQRPSATGRSGARSYKLWITRNESEAEPTQRTAYAYNRLRPLFNLLLLYKQMRRLSTIRFGLVIDASSKHPVRRSAAAMRAT
jgi:hypothetical protein